MADQLTKHGLANVSYAWNNFGAGRLVASLTRLQGPDFPVEMVEFTLKSTATGKVYIGGSDVSSVVGRELSAGDSTGWIPIKNLNLVYYVGTVNNATDDLHYMYVR